MKTLYKFSVSKKEQVEERTENEDGSVTLKKVTKDVPTYVYTRLPSRRDREEISFIYNGAYGDAVKRGLQTADVLRRALLDSGGVIAQNDLERADELTKLIIAKKNEILQKELEKEDIKDDAEEYEALVAEFEKLERPQREIFARSADSHAQTKTVEWCVLNMTFYRDENDNYIPVFPGNTTESKLNSYYEFCDNEDEHKWEVEVYNKATIVFYHFIVTGETDKKYFDSLFPE